MKAKFLFMLFLVSLCSGAFAAEHRKKTARVHIKIVGARVLTRTPFEPFMQAEDINDCLYLTFQFSLQDADITIIDKEGNEVIKEQQTIIYEGRIISIPMANDYPYSVEITSPVVEILGEVVLDEE